MKIYYNKAKPDIEYVMSSGRRFNHPKRKPNADGADGFVTYFYISLDGPQSGIYCRNREYYIIPTRVMPEVYAELCE